MVLQTPIDAGRGAPFVVLHGFAMRPVTYSPLARLLEARCRVVVPDLFAWRGRWRYPAVLDAFASTLDELELDRVSLLAHSFGGGIALGFAARYPDRVVEAVFSDTLAASGEWMLADEALRHPIRLLHLATPAAASAFAYSWAHHPRQMVGAAWWGFTSSRGADSTAVARAGIPAHVLWANRDSVLSQTDGRKFADEMRASFTVASTPDEQALDHDWMFQQPQVFFHHLEGLNLTALVPAVHSAGGRR
jgi:pimeloyl-ACP methyl ester carboxylesterase